VGRRASDRAVRLKARAPPPDQQSVPVPRHGLAGRRAPLVTWDAAAGAAALLVAALVALCVPEADLTLHTVDRTPSPLPAVSQADAPDWHRGGQDP
jgi:hypothetical protein